MKQIMQRRSNDNEIILFRYSVTRIDYNAIVTVIVRIFYMNMYYRSVNTKHRQHFP